jgi:pilus assembly protein CpaD
MERAMNAKRLSRLMRPALAAAALLPLLAACNVVDRKEIVGSIPEDYRTRHPIVLEEGLATLDLPVAIDQAVLSKPVRGTVLGFGKGFTESGAKMVAIITPSGSPNQAAAAAAGSQIRQLFLSQGIPASAIDTRLYAAGPREASAAVRIAYSRVTAKTTPCGIWSDQTARHTENRNYGQFGCATQQNLAVMVDNPMDLVAPREMEPPDAERRGVVIENYRSGSKPTQSDTSQDYRSRPGAGNIAEGVGQ